MKTFFKNFFLYNEYYNNTSTSRKNDTNQWKSSLWILIAQMNNVRQETTRCNGEYKVGGSSILARNFPDFSGGFWQLPVLSSSVRPEIIGKKSAKFSAGILLPSSRHFPCFSAGSDDFPTSFLRNLVERSTWV